MREIKFRAWLPKNKQLLDNNDLLQQSWDSEPTIAHALRDDGTNYILMQYTGLKDKNGVEIWEGDILNFTYWWFDGNEAEMPLTGEVVYVPEEASYGLAHIRSKEWLRHIGAQDTDEDTATFSGWQFSSDDIEVIGNTWENPELLEEGK